MKEIIKINGMSCASCQNAIETKVSKMNGVKKAEVSLLNKELIVEFDNTTKEEIINTVEGLGYKVRGKEKNNLKLSVIFTIPLFLISMLPMIGINIFSDLSGIIQLLLVLPIMYLNKNIFIKGFKLLFKGIPNMDSLIAIGTTSAFIFSLYELLANMTHFYFETTGVILTLTLIGKTLEEKAKGKSSDAIKKLTMLAPPKAMILNVGEVSIDEVKINDLVVIKSGSKIPLDGEIVEGNGIINESMLTGESLPVSKKTNDKLYGGTVLENGYIVYKVIETKENGVLGQIIKVVEEAQRTKAPIAKIADFVSGYFVKVIMIIAILTFITWFIYTKDIESSLTYFVSVLIIACPCALGLATPVTITVASAKSAELGVLFKNSVAIENLGKAEVIVFDKTGTLTEGIPELSDIITSSEDDLKICASLEFLSEHSLSDAITRSYKGEYYSVSQFDTSSGYGISGIINNKIYKVGSKEYLEKNNIGLNYLEKDYYRLSKEGKTVIILFDEKPLALFAITDKIKENSKKVIEYLKHENIKSILLTGDNEIVASKVGNDLNIDEIISDVKPIDKAKKIENLKQNYKHVVMIGDGINDAPALATADVSVAIGSGTDIAIESANVILIRKDIISLIDSIRLSKTTLKNIKQNLFLAFVYNTLAIPIAAGMFALKLNPMIAALAMSLSSLSVIFNALRLNRFRGE